MPLLHFKRSLGTALVIGTILGLSACTQTIERTNYVVFFDSESSNLTPAGEAIVQEAAKMINKTHQDYIRISASSGHKGDNTKFKQLADQRAQSVMTSLEKNGVSEKSLHLIPFTPDDAEDSRVALRRVNIQLGQD